MKVYNIQDMVGGWYIGDFEPSILRTRDFEVGYKIHPAGEEWDVHMHAVATEYNLLLRGVMKIQDTVLSAGNLFVIEAGEWADPEFLEDCEVITVKVPSVPGDKYTKETWDSEEVDEETLEILGRY